jgi:hypothetical protein
MKRGLLKRRLCRSFLFKWTKDRGNEPQRPKEEYPWLWDGGTFKESG